jgi:hypothetical protein
MSKPIPPEVKEWFAANVGRPSVPLEQRISEKVCTNVSAPTHRKLKAVAERYGIRIMDLVRLILDESLKNEIDPGEDPAKVAPVTQEEGLEP